MPHPLLYWLPGLVALLAFRTLLTRRPYWAVVGFAAGYALAALPALLSGLNVVGVAQLLFLAGACFVPAALGVWAVHLRRNHGGSGRRTSLALLTVATVMAGTGSYARFVEPERLVVEHSQLRTTGLTEPLRIAVLADWEFDEVDEHMQRVVDRVLSERPDLILLPGDFFQGEVDSLRARLAAIRQLFAQLRAPLGVFAVAGDSESPAVARWIFEGTDIRVLANECARIDLPDGRRLQIAGLLNPAWPELMRPLREQALAEPADFRILLSHRPDIVLDRPSVEGFDLVVAGHTHGGQIQIPGYGPMLKASWIPRHAAAGGLHEVNGTPLLVNTGTGVERGQAPRVRLFCPPRIDILTLQPGQA